MTAVSHTQRTLRYLEKRKPGWELHRATWWQATPYAKVPGRRIDFLGFCDWIALGTPPMVGIIGIQVCAGSGMAEHVKKILALPSARRFLDLRNRIVVFGWRKLASGKWSPRIREIRLDDFNETR